MKIENKIVDELYTEVNILRSNCREGSVEWFCFTGAIGMLERLQIIDQDLDTDTSLKSYALNIIKDLEEDGADLTEGSYVLQWSYDERPDVLITLVLGDFDCIEDDPGGLH